MAFLFDRAFDADRATDTAEGGLVTGTAHPVAVTATKASLCGAQVLRFVGSAIEQQERDGEEQREVEMSNGSFGHWKTASFGADVWLSSR
jgi:hypothetical protein